MRLTKNETNNAIVVALENVRPHPNADRLQLATVLGTTVVVGLDAEEGDHVVYFDSNLCLSNAFLKYNNLYSDPTKNLDMTKKGYFGKNGRVKAQRFRGEVSNGYVIAVMQLFAIPELADVLWSAAELNPGIEFQAIEGVLICEKYVAPLTKEKGESRMPKQPASKMFHRHWDTKKFMRSLDTISAGEIYLEEKVHGTSGRTGNVLCDVAKRWWQFWKPTQEWRVLSGTRRVDNIGYHIPQTRKQIEDLVAPHLRRGEEIYYEIFGSDTNGAAIQSGFSYGFDKPLCMLYRVTITTEDGKVHELNRKEVYRRADELGLLTPYVVGVVYVDGSPNSLVQLRDRVMNEAQGKSHWDARTILEGVVVWHCNEKGVWSCLKKKSEEFLMLESKQRDKGQDDVEDNL